MKVARHLLPVVATAMVAATTRGPLETTMQRHMLVQMPLLLATGVLMVQALALRAPSRPTASAWNAHGVAGLLLAGGVVMTWMIPRALDAAVEHVAVDGVKFASLIAAGAVACLSWREANAVVRTFFVGNMAWMTATVGMLLLDAPVRLCTSYGASDQRGTGIAFLALAVLSVAGACIRTMCRPAGRSALSRHRATM